jgi:hypothetical protein
MMTLTRKGAVGIAAAAALAVAASPATADAGLSAGQAAKLQRQVDQVLRHAAPGARQVAPNRVSWPRDRVTLTLSVPGRAQAAQFADCPRLYACLWQDAGGVGRRVQFFYYRHYNLTNYGMPPGTHRGASSAFNNQTGGADAYLNVGNTTYWFWAAGNIPRQFNDKARTITLLP